MMSKNCRDGLSGVGELEKRRYCIEVNEINPWLWCVMLFIYCWIQFYNILLGILHLYDIYWFVVFLSCNAFILFFYWTHRMS